eukprot:g10510.t1
MFRLGSGTQQETATPNFPVESAGVLVMSTCNLRCRVTSLQRWRRSGGGGTVTSKVSLSPELTAATPRVVLLMVVGRLPGVEYRLMPDARLRFGERRLCGRVGSGQLRRRRGPQQMGGGTRATAQASFSDSADGRDTSKAIVDDKADMLQEMHRQLRAAREKVREECGAEMRQELAAAEALMREEVTGDIRQKLAAAVSPQHAAAAAMMAELHQERTRHVVHRSCDGKAGGDGEASPGDDPPGLRSADRRLGSPHPRGGIEGNRREPQTYQQGSPGWSREAPGTDGGRRSRAGAEGGKPG